MHGNDALDAADCLSDAEHRLPVDNAALTWKGLLTKRIESELYYTRRAKKVPGPGSIFLEINGHFWEAFQLCVSIR